MFLHDFADRPCRAYIVGDAAEKFYYRLEDKYAVLTFSSKCTCSLMRHFMPFMPVPFIQPCTMFKNVRSFMFIRLFMYHSCHVHACSCTSRHVHVH